MQTRRAFLNAASILLVSGRAIADVPTPKNEVPKLDCELIVEKNTGREDSGFGGVLILKNTTKAPYKIAYMDDPTEHLAVVHHCFCNFPVAGGPTAAGVARPCRPSRAIRLESGRSSPVPWKVPTNPRRPTDDDPPHAE